MPNLNHRDWVPLVSETLIQEIANWTSASDANSILDEIDRLTDWNRQIHEQDCINLNPATNTMNPRAEAALAKGLGSRPSLGYPGAKYEMGLEAIERIEVIAAELAAEVFGATYAEIRVGSGALANLYAFMATTKPGDTIIVPPAQIGGHVTHHKAGAAGLFGLNIVEAPVAPDNYTVDLNALRDLAKKTSPSLITIGGSLNLSPHPVAEIRSICDEVGTWLLYDAAHMCGMIAAKEWQQPLEEGAHLMGMSTYKSLGGPAGGLIVTNEAELAERLDKIAFPGLTANFDAAKSAALAITLLDWRDFGRDYGAMMKATAAALAKSLSDRQLPIFGQDTGPTQSNQFAMEAHKFGGGQTMANRLRRANILTCGIGLPLDPVEGDMNGLRFGTPETARFGMQVEDMDAIAEFIHRALTDEPEKVASDLKSFRQRFQNLHFVHAE